MAYTPTVVPKHPEATEERLNCCTRRRSIQHAVIGGQCRNRFHSDPAESRENLLIAAPP